MRILIDTDAIIAATALAHGLPLLTSDFGAVPGLLVLNPHDAAQLPPLGGSSLQ